MELNKEGNLENGEDCIENEYTNGEDSSNPNLANEVNSTENKKLKGDAIGETMYSERYVLKTLLQLMDCEWSEELENDLCSVWDMTTDKDVVDFLLENNFIDLSIGVIKDTKELRLIEIMVGIVGNMCVYPEASAKVISLQEIDVFLSLITITDTPILIQLMRLYKALLFCENVDSHLIITDNTVDQITFILRSSQNSELLLYTLQVTAEIINKKKIEILGANILDNVNEAFKELSKNFADEICVSRDFEKSISAYLKVLENMCSALEEIIETEKYNNFINQFSVTSVEGTISCLEIILNLCSDSELIQNMPETVEYFLYCSANFVLSFRAPFRAKILKLFFEIFEIIIDNNLTFESDVCSSIVDFLIYAVNKGDTNQVHDTFQSWTKSKLRILFIDNIINKNECSDNFISKVNNLCNS